MLAVFAAASHSCSRVRAMSAAAAARICVSASVGGGSEGVVRVGTHNGTFHCDEALACFLIRLTNKFGNADIVRTRNQEILDKMDAVVDVGGVYDPAKFRFDHHQRGFDHVLGNGFNTKLSSAGLVYKLFGKEIVAKELGLEQEHPNVEAIYVALYKNFMEAIDAIDNGVNQYDVDQPPKYVDNTNLSARVGKLNPDWTEDQSVEAENGAFARAMELTGSEFQQALAYHTRSWLPARSIVLDCINARKEIHPSGEIMLLSKFCPWKQHLFELEAELQIDPSIKYVLYEDERAQQWRVQAVALAPGRFESRKGLPGDWRGLRDQELSQTSGIENGVFVHASGFIGGNKSLDGALRMAVKSLAMP